MIVKTPSPFRLRPDREALLAGFRRKYGESNSLGPGPRRRLSYQYFLPSDIYETTVEQLVSSETRWLDVGGGKSLFPENNGLATELANRCRELVAVDPDPNIHENSFAHRKHQSLLESWTSDSQFDLITARMVAEHVEYPSQFMGKISDLLAPGGIFLMFTVNRFAPLGIIAAGVPFRFHHTIKRVFWGTSVEDTFPTHYKLNTFRVQTRFANQVGLETIDGLRLNDCSSTGALGHIANFELATERLFRAVHLPYPEHCLLSAFRKPCSVNS